MGDCGAGRILVAAEPGQPVRCPGCGGELCETCNRVWGYTAVHMTPDGTCAWLGHSRGAAS
jgi:hypothetical protein